MYINVRPVKHPQNISNAADFMTRLLILQRRGRGRGGGNMKAPQIVTTMGTTETMSTEGHTW
jgi:hypothetical protein